MVSVTTFKDNEEAWRSPTTRCTASAPASGAAMPIAVTNRPRHPGRARLDQLLPRLSGARSIRRLQGVRFGRETHKMMLDHYRQTKSPWSAIVRKDSASSEPYAGGGTGWKRRASARVAAFLWDSRCNSCGLVLRGRRRSKLHQRTNLRRP